MALVVYRINKYLRTISFSKNHCYNESVTILFILILLNITKIKRKKEILD